MEEKKATKKCPYCGEEILEEAIKCRFCGEWLDDSKKDSKAATSMLNESNESKEEILKRAAKYDGIGFTGFFFSFIFAVIANVAVTYFWSYWRSCNLEMGLINIFIFVFVLSAQYVCYLLATIISETVIEKRFLKMKSLIYKARPFWSEYKTVSGITHGRVIIVATILLIHLLYSLDLWFDLCSMINIVIFIIIYSFICIIGIALTAKNKAKLNTIKQK